MTKCDYLIIKLLNFTTHALVNMMHNWLVNTDGNVAMARVVLLDFRKAFDLINHSVLVQKLTPNMIFRVKSKAGLSTS